MLLGAELAAGATGGLALRPLQSLLFLSTQDELRAMSAYALQCVGSGAQTHGRRHLGAEFSDRGRFRESEASS